MLILQKNLVDVSFRIQIDKEITVAVEPHYVGSDYKGAAQGEVFIFALTSAIAFIAGKMPEKELQVLKAIQALEQQLPPPEHDSDLEEE